VLRCGAARCAVECCGAKRRVAQRCGAMRSAAICCGAKCRVAERGDEARSEAKRGEVVRRNAVYAALRSEAARGGAVWGGA
jgi:hypothetical protein